MRDGRDRLVGIAEISDREVPACIVKDAAKRLAFADELSLKSPNGNSEAIRNVVRIGFPIRDEERNGALDAIGHRIVVADPRHEIQQPSRMSDKLGIGEFVWSIETGRSA